MVVEGISELEQSIAARTSYAFWAWEHIRASSPDADVTLPLETEFAEIRVQMAMREARRHYVGQSGDYESALARFKSALEWREVRFIVRLSHACGRLFSVDCRYPSQPALIPLVFSEGNEN
jgi:hypothetical protein